MEWHHFEYFKVLAEMEHMTNAAKKLSVSQSALSRAIMKLEEELGVALFDRRGRSIFINKYGIEFLETVERILKEFDHVKGRLQEMVGVEAGEITLGFLHTVGSTYLSYFLQQFRTLYPNVNVKLVQNNSKILMDMLQKGIIDLCLTSAVQVEKPICWQPLVTETLYVTLSENHPLANRQQLYIEELSKEKFILLKEGFALRILTEHIFRKVEITPEVSFEGEEIYTIASFIAADLGIALLPKLKQFALTNVVQIPIANTNIKTEREIGLCWNEESVDTIIMKEARIALIHYFQNMND